MPATVKKQLFLITASILYLLALLHYTLDFPKPFLYASGLIAAGFLVYQIFKGKIFKNISSKISLMLFAVAAVISLLSILSILYQRNVAGDWENKVKESLIEVSKKIQSKFIALQTDIDHETATIDENLKKLKSKLTKNQKITPEKLQNFLFTQQNTLRADEYLTGLSLFDAKGKLLTWAGANAAEDLPFVSEWERRDSFFYHTGDEVKTCLNQVKIIKDGNRAEYFLVYRRLLRSNFHIQNRFFSDYDFFNDISDFKIQANYITDEDLESMRQWENLFYRNRDFYWGQSTELTRTLTVPLRNLSLEIIGYVSITSPSLSEQLFRIQTDFNFYATSLLLLSQLIIIITLFRILIKKNTNNNYKKEHHTERKRFYQTIALIAMLWILRFSLILLGYPVKYSSLSLFHPSYFALTGYFNLFISPFDFFFSTTTIILTIWLIFERFVKRLPQKPAISSEKENQHYTKAFKISRKGKKFPIYAVFIISIAFMILATNLCIHFVQAVFVNSRTNILGSFLLDFDFSQFLMQCSMLEFTFLVVLLHLTLFYMVYLVLRRIHRTSTARIIVYLTIIPVSISVYLIQGELKIKFLLIILIFIPPLVLFFLLNRFLRISKSPSRLLYVGFTLLIAILGGLFFSPIYFHIFQEHQSDFIEQNLVNRIEEQREWKTILIQRSLDSFARNRTLQAKLKHRNVIQIEALAYSLWSNLDSSLKGYNTMLEIRDSEGRIIDRFSINPLFNGQNLTILEEDERSKISQKWIYYDNQNIEVIVGQCMIREGNQNLASIILGFALDYNYIFLPTVRNPYYELFRTTEGSFISQAVFDQDLLFMVYDPEGNYISGSEEFMIPLSRAKIKTLNISKSPVWFKETVGDNNYNLLAFKHRDEIFVLGFPKTKLLNILFYYSELLGIIFITLLIFTMFFLILNFKKNLDLFKNIFTFKFFVRKSYWRLFLTFIILSLIPIFYLSFFSREYLNTKMSNEVIDRGINSLKVVKRYLDFNVLRAIQRDEKTILTTITDPLITDIGRWVNRDLNIYLGRELIATNKQELFFSRLLATMVNSYVYNGLVYEKELFTYTNDQIGELSYLVVSTLIPTDEPSLPLIITIPLMSEQNRIRIELAAFDRLIMLVTITLILIFALISHLIAKHITKPLLKLTEGAQLIEAGDYDVQIDIERKDEIGSLVKSFNQMSKSLDKQRSELFKKTRDLQSILENASTAVISFSPDNKIQTINPSAIQLLKLGNDIKEYLGKDLFELLSERSGFNYLKDAITNYTHNPIKPFRSDLRIVFQEDKVEQEIVANLVITPMLDQKGKLYASLLIIEDVTEIIRSKRLEAWAEMARIIAHEIKNPLTPILLAAEHMQQVIKDKPRNMDDISNECLTTILDQVSVLQQISNDFSRYARLPQLKPEPVNIGSFLKDVVSPYTVAPPENVKINLEIPSRAATVLIDKKLIKQTLINLFENSFHAMSDGGTLTIKVDQSKNDKAQGTISILVSDTGLGINPKLQSKIFEPYFTTKDGGVGLGLAIAKKTIEEHQGEIELKSEVGKGTTIKIVLKTYKGKTKATDK